MRKITTAPTAGPATTLSERTDQASIMPVCEATGSHTRPWMKLAIMAPTSGNHNISNAWATCCLHVHGSPSSSVVTTGCPAAAL